MELSTEELELVYALIEHYQNSVPPSINVNKVALLEIKVSKEISQRYG